MKKLEQLHDLNSNKNFLVAVVFFFLIDANTHLKLIIKDIFIISIIKIVDIKLRL